MEVMRRALLTSRSIRSSLWIWYLVRLHRLLLRPLQLRQPLVTATVLLPISSVPQYDVKLLLRLLRRRQVALRYNSLVIQPSRSYGPIEEDEEEDEQADARFRHAAARAEEMHRLMRNEPSSSSYSQVVSQLSAATSSSFAAGNRGDVNGPAIGEVDDADGEAQSPVDEAVQASENSSYIVPSSVDHSQILVEDEEEGEDDEGDDEYEAEVAAYLSPTRTREHDQSIHSDGSEN